MLNVAPQNQERIPDHLRAMAEQDDKSAASGKTGEQPSIGASVVLLAKSAIRRSVSVLSTAPPALQRCGICIWERGRVVVPALARSLPRKIFVHTQTRSE